jgi:hypothetical protein
MDAGRRSAAIGQFMTVGGLGAVADPPAANAILAASSWRVLVEHGRRDAGLYVLALLREEAAHCGGGRERTGSATTEQSGARHQTTSVGAFAMPCVPGFWVIATQ